MAERNLFALLGMPPVFAIDLQALEKAYFTQQRLYHPDRVVKKTEAERQQALLRSIEINTAYDTLKKPLLRAQYLLHLQGIEVGTESDNIKPASHVLVEAMGWRDAIDEAENTETLKKLSNLLTAVTMKAIDSIARSHARKQWQDMAQETLRLSYAMKAQEAMMAQQKRLEQKTA